MKFKTAFFFFALILLQSCSKSEDTTPTITNTKMLRVDFDFNEEQARLNNLGQASTVPATHATQTPDFHAMSVHMIELAPNQFTPVGSGIVLYKGLETTVSGNAAIDFDKAIVANEKEVFKTIDLSDIPAGTYEYLRVSVAYQNYDIRFNLRNIPVIGDLSNEKARLASFLGFHNFLTTIKPYEMELVVNDAHRQGFWAFETQLSSPYENYNQILSGNAPEGATTVVNPLAGISDIPQGSCIVTGKFATPLVITEDKDKDIHLTLSFSINNSFEWIDSNDNDQLDFDATTPANSEKVVDMGLRGLIPKWEY